MKPPNMGRYKWNESHQSLILGAFFWGYILMQIPGGLLTLRYGPKRLGAVCIAGSALADLCVPIFAQYGYWCLIVLRIIQGLFQGAVMPIVGCLLGRWVPLDQRSRYTAFVYAGTQFGAVVGQAVAGELSQTRAVWNPMTQAPNYVNRWPNVHHLFGTLGLLFSGWWYYLVFDWPNVHPRITQAEMDGLKRRFDPTVFGCLRNGWLSSIPYVVQVLIAQVVARVSDLLIASRTASVTQVRRVNNLIALGGAGLGLVCVGLAGCRQTEAVLLLLLSVGVLGFASAGYQSNLVDLSPPLAAQRIVISLIVEMFFILFQWAIDGYTIKFTGACFLLLSTFFDFPLWSANIVSITNTVATLPGIFGPLLVGHVIKYSSSVSQWMIVFSVSAIFAWFAAIVNLCFTSGLVQPWTPSRGETVAKV